MMGMGPHREIRIQQDRTTSILFQLLELIVMRHEMKGIYDNSFIVTVSNPLLLPVIFRHQSLSLNSHPAGESSALRRDLWPHLSVEFCFASPRLSLRPLKFILLYGERPDISAVIKSAG